MCSVVWFGLVKLSLGGPQLTQCGSYSTKDVSLGWGAPMKFLGVDATVQRVD